MRELVDADSASLLLILVIASTGGDAATQQWSRLEELTFGTFNIRTAAVNGVKGTGFGMSLFLSIFVTLPFSVSTESTSCVFPFRMVFFYLVTTGWVFDISSCENSINTINQSGCDSLTFAPLSDHERD